MESLGLDEDALGSFEASAPGEVGAVAAALSAGQTPRQLLVGSIHAPQAVEAALIELARRGVILGVHGDAGEDLVATNLRAPDSQPGEAEDDDDLPERDGFGPLMWFAVLFVLAATRLRGLRMMLDSQRRADHGTVERCPETAPAEATAADDAPAADPSEAAPDLSARFPTACRAREDGLSFRHAAARRAPRGRHGARRRACCTCSRPAARTCWCPWATRTWAPPQQDRAPRGGRHAVRYRVGSRVID
ncbi:MAG: hypothetical protein IPH72_28585, partial [Sandaracinaceae bacterium]|nr:hypothetical protein [Sandaracinaceae bacterium]